MIKLIIVNEPSGTEYDYDFSDVPTPIIKKLIASGTVKWKGTLDRLNKQSDDIRALRLELVARR